MYVIQKRDNLRLYLSNDGVWKGIDQAATFLGARDAILYAAECEISGYQLVAEPPKKEE